MTEWNGGAGPRIVAIGGGTGLSTMLRGLKSRTRSLTAIVTVADDGGGSGMLRQDLGMPPPGDIRHCMEALANAEPVMQQLLTYRFPEGSGNLTGQSFGNLILAALNGISDSFDQAVARMSEVLAISGRVLPVTNENVALEATFENGTRVLGESKISAFKKEQDCRIESVRLLPEHPKVISMRVSRSIWYRNSSARSVWICGKMRRLCSVCVRRRKRPKRYCPPLPQRASTCRLLRP